MEPLLVARPSTRRLHRQALEAAVASPYLRFVKTMCVAFGVGTCSVHS